MSFVHVTGRILTLAACMQPCLTSAASFSVSVLDLRGGKLLYSLHHFTVLPSWTQAWFQAKSSWLDSPEIFKDGGSTSFHTAERGSLKGFKAKAFIHWTVASPVKRTKMSV